MTRTGRWTQLERLRGSADPVQLLTAVPGLGHRLAERIHEELHVDTLEGARTRRARRPARIGAGRRAAPRRGDPREPAGDAVAQPPALRPGGGTARRRDRPSRRCSRWTVSTATRRTPDALPTIAPRRFNPSGEAWLPVLHTVRDGWHFTALFSNTAQAHQLDRTRDWVVIYFYDDEHAEGQHTVVTETHGPLAGRRVVRGRETECRAHYAGEETAAPGHAASG